LNPPNFYPAGAITYRWKISLFQTGEGYALTPEEALEYKTIDETSRKPEVLNTYESLTRPQIILLMTRRILYLFITCL
jgi:hypothetical protein